MNKEPDRLYDLLPVVYRRRDAEEGYPLRALLRVIAEQVDVVESDIDQLYENWFIETCEPWVVPYIGDLIGYRPLHELGESQDASPTGRARERTAILIPRSEVANTIRYRRRKGTLALLELLARDVAGWPARAVAFYRLLGWTQAMNHLWPDRGRTVDLRMEKALARLDGPFDVLSHTVELRRIDSSRSTGRSNIPSIGVFVWRMRSYPVTRSQAYRLERGDDLRYTFSVLRADTQLYAKPEQGDGAESIAGERDVPAPIRRQAFEDNPAAYYGPDKSLQVWRGVPPKPVPLDAIVPADLSVWDRYRCREGQVAVDPELGRILFHPSALPQNNVRIWVSYHYGFSDELGGGEYSRALLPTPGFRRYQVGREAEFERLSEAKAAWEEDAPSKAVIEISDSRVYSEQINISLLEGQTLHLRAANRCRPVLRQLDYDPSLTDAFSITGESESRFVLDGVLLTGRPLRIEGPLAEVVVRHSTLVPGWTLEPDLEPERGLESSLQLYDTPGVRVKIERSILGSIQVKLNEVEDDPIPISISDSVLDATEPEIEALGTPEWQLGVSGRRAAHAVLTIARSTVFGTIDVHAIDLAENTIFDSPVKVSRRQTGCVRFCYVPPDSRTPRRYNCQPDTVEETIKEAAASGTISEETAAQRLAREQMRVRPRFNSRRYGTPDYAQLADDCAEEITEGAADESEMGVFHDLYQPQREANLRTRLEEYTPADMDVGIIFAS
jgi:hypothetical protein